MYHKFLHCKCLLLECTTVQHPYSVVILLFMASMKVLVFQSMVCTIHCILLRKRPCRRHHKPLQAKQMKVHSLFTSVLVPHGHVMLSSLATCILYLLLCCVCTPDFATVYAEFIKTLILMEATLAAENEVRFLTHIVYFYYQMQVNQQVNTKQVHKNSSVQLLATVSP